MTKSTQYAHCSVDGWYTSPVGLRLTRCLVKKQDLDDEKSLRYRVVQRTRLTACCQYKQLVPSVDTSELIVLCFK